MYFGTVLGYVWSLARPLLLFAVLLTVFTQVFRIGSQVPNYPVLLLFNIVLFGFFQESTNAAVTSIVAQEGVVRKTQFPRLVIPLASVIAGLVDFCIAFIVLLGLMFWYGITPTWAIVTLPLFVLLAVMVALSAGLWLSALNVPSSESRGGITLGNRPAAASN